MLNGSWRQKLTKENLINDKQNALNCLISNGIVDIYSYANNTFVRFSLDPLAEYLSAMYSAKLCGTDNEKWKALYKKVNHKGTSASSYLQALEIVHFTYAKIYGWPL